MSKKMLIDAAHAEETRVVLIDGTRVEDFDFESKNRKQLRGNIYLAKVTRVEPSLQAAFIEYGGNRHGFLAFNEIHPDYYQIPVADREALMREEAEEDESFEPASRSADPDDEDAEAVADEDDVMEEEVARRRRRLMRKYKIQEVIRRRQIMLVQVVKEERGNKGAALTTYLSLAGRYGVLMPNTARGGGISRKITTATDRKRLKSVVQGLDVPQGMGLIVRTAGAKRTKAEIKRDYEYLLRLWENIRENTLHSIAPALIYEEEDLVKRAIRDLYDKDIEGVFVEGEAGFKEARDFMRMLMPSQTKKVQAYRDPEPLFVKYKVEDHLSQIYSPVVPLRSGGYLVINQTEALVAVDVNSGKSTRERNIEATALKTNLEAAEETARQLRLRDLAGLIVIDFIDMDESKNNRAVEKKLKDALKDDRARIQMGKISGFGLMEISRQRRRTGVLEGTTHVCEHCNGTGRVRSVESSALATLRALEIEALKGGGEATLKAPRAVALYILNEKRAHLARIHETFGLFVTVVVDDAMPHADYEIERTASETRPDHAIPIPSARSRLEPIEDDGYDDSYEDEEDEDEEDEEEGPAPVRSASVADEDDEDEDEDREEASGEDDADGRTRGRGRRRRRRGGRRDEEERAPAPEADARLEDENGGRRRRRGRRGGRRLREDRPGEAFAWVRPWVPYGEDPFVWFDLSEDPRMAVPEVTASAAASQAPAAESSAPAEQSAAPVARAPAQAGGEDDIWVELPEPEDKPKRRRSRGKAKALAAEAVEAASPEAAVEAPESVAEAEAPAVAAEETPAAEPAKPKRTRTRRKAEPKAEADAVADVIAEAAEESVPVAAQPAPQPEAQPEPQAVPEPMATPAPQPVEAVATAEPAAPDPAEITAPPAKPRRGWWRRG
ncbi:Rne/Rng family ribonuclease [Phenylobacterium sp.]|uniref:ribonuclease E/G n=1 Tax=Phenylobacterium sp. TaxID=1871053 RepID=UPI000C96C7C5|nr:Rne/Rng family ribonuclease [Phenylobacterium sp.]MAK80868.1 ribonuclease E/G [Phenylobacterium sp.]|tara:strand:- start:62645 stop:65341 length:2697 start_codon:yes stop_codon:yes gene_type:complete